MIRHITRKKFIAGAALLVAVSGAAIHLTDKSQANSPVAAAPAIPVTVETIQSQKVRVWTEFSGRLHAVDSAEIKPEVSGRITEVRFKDGKVVKEGDILFVIDPRPYEAAVAKAEANLATAQTNAHFAKTDKERAAGLIKTKAIAQRLFDERSNADRVAAAAVKAADAELRQAKIDLEHAYVKAPISGQASRAELTVGNLVQAGANAPLLTSIVANDAIYADFDVDEQTYIQSIRNIANNRTKAQHIPVKLTVQGDKTHPYQGTIYSFDNRIDAASGTIRARAKFDNTDGTLIPGMFASVSMAGGAEEEALLVPAQALGFDQNKKFVYVVGNDNKVSYREVTLGKEVDAKRIVLNGLNAGDRVIVDGTQHVRPDVIVEARELNAGKEHQNVEASNDSQLLAKQ